MRTRARGLSNAAKQGSQFLYEYLRPLSVHIIFLLESKKKNCIVTNEKYKQRQFYNFLGARC